MNNDHFGIEYSGYDEHELFIDEDIYFYDWRGRGMVFPVTSEQLLELRDMIDEYADALGWEEE